MAKVAVITGANRGLGKEMVRQLLEKEYVVIMSSRDERTGKEAYCELSELGELYYHTCDVTSDDSVKKFADFIKNTVQKVDVLINNAGAVFDFHDSILSAHTDKIKKTIEINTLGAIRVTNAVRELIPPSSIIINVSSAMGQLSTMGHLVPGYRLSKTALNAVTCMFAKALEDLGITVVSACPGWVKTDMGGSNADLSVQEGAQNILCLIDKQVPTGSFYSRGEPIGW